MIPFAIFACELRGAESLEVRALELSTEGFTFRLDSSQNIKDYPEVTLHFYSFKHNAYRDYTPASYTVTKISETPFYTEYRMKLGDGVYVSFSSQLMNEYSKYISLKLEEEERYVSQELTGYPADLEVITSECFMEQKRSWMKSNISVHKHNDSEKDETINRHVEQEIGPKKNQKVNENINDKYAEQIFGISLDRPDLWEQYMRDDCVIMMQDYFMRNAPDILPPPFNTIRYLYIGNQFCPLLTPNVDQLELLFERAIENSQIPVFVLSFVRDMEVEMVTHKLDVLCEWFQKKRAWIESTCGMTRLEIVVNDWGTLGLLKTYAEKTPMSITLGTLLSKRRKDTRLKWKNGYSETMENSSSFNEFGKSALNDEMLIKELRNRFADLHISYDSCGYKMEIDAYDSTLFFPYYQMNTSSFCTLYAFCHNHDRGHQEMVQKCPRYCDNYAFLYPDFLHMVGKYNSLFGYDDSFFNDEDWLEKKQKSGISRFIWNLL